MEKRSKAAWSTQQGWGWRERGERGYSAKAVRDFCGKGIPDAAKGCSKGLTAGGCQVSLRNSEKVSGAAGEKLGGPAGHEVSSRRGLSRGPKGL